MEHHLFNSLQCHLRLNQLKQVHALITINCHSLTSLFIQKLLNLSLIDYARKVFDQIHQPDPRSCNSFIASYSRLGLNKEALDMFVMMHHRDLGIGSFTIPPVVKSCSALSAVELGKQVHSLVIQYGLEWNLFVQTALIDFYAKDGDLGSARTVFDTISVKDPVSYNCLISGYSKCGDSVSARRLFDEMTQRTIVSWNSIISCYAHNGDLNEAMRMFERMRGENYYPNEFTVVTMLSVCSKSGNLEMGMKIKMFIDENNMFSNMIIATALVEMLVKCGAVDEARREFDKMDKRDIVAWGTMIAGYAQNERSTEALDLFEEMKRKNMRPNDVILVSVLSACAQLGSMEAGERLGSFVEREDFVSNLYVASSLLNMYSKCGQIMKARRVFDKVKDNKDIVVWNSIITGLAFNGHAEEAIGIYKEMKESGVKPNDVTFVSLLTGCTHEGMVDQGLNLFYSMKPSHGIVPKIEHCACIVDLFCRYGQLNKAYEFICKMEIEANDVIWGTLLSGCRNHSNVELAEVAVEKLKVLEPDNSGNYVQLSNVYANSGRWQDALRMRSMMIDKKVQKTAAYSWIEQEDGIHKFLVSDSSHPRSDEIYSIIDVLALQSSSEETDVVL